MPRLGRSAPTPFPDVCRCAHQRPEGTMDLTARRVASLVVGLIVAIFSADAISPPAGLLLGVISAFLWHQVTSASSCNGTCRQAAAGLPQEGGHWQDRRAELLRGSYQPQRRHSAGSISDFPPPQQTAARSFSDRSPWAWQGPQTPPTGSFLPFNLVQPSGEVPVYHDTSAPPLPPASSASNHTVVGRGHERSLATPTGAGAAPSMSLPPPSSASNHTVVGRGHERSLAAPTGAGAAPLTSLPPPSSASNHTVVGRGHERPLATPTGDHVRVGERRS